MLRANTSTTTSSTSITEQAWHVLPKLIHMKFSLHDTSLGKITMQIVYNILHRTYRKILQFNLSVSITVSHILNII